jgi:tetratricopeptide (TPR) repeat protein
VEKHRYYAAEFEKQKDYRGAQYEYEYLDRLVPEGGYRQKVIEMTHFFARDTTFRRVAVAVQQSSFELARARLDTIQKLYPGDPEVLRWSDRLKLGQGSAAAIARAMTLRDAKRFDEAISLLDSLSRADPEHAPGTEIADVLLSKAYALSRTNEAAARQAFGALLERDPANAEAKQGLASLDHPKQYAAYVEEPLPPGRKSEAQAGTAIATRTKPVAPKVVKPESVPRLIAETLPKKDKATASAPAEVEGDSISARAEWEAAVALLSGYGETAQAVAKLQKARELSPDPNSKYNRKAVEKLRAIGRM